MSSVDAAPGNTARPPRVLFLNPAGQGGGAEAALGDLLAALRGARPDWPLRLLALEDGPLLEQARGLGVETEVFPLPPVLRGLGEGGASVAGSVRAGAAALGFAGKLRGQMLAWGPDLVHSNGMKTHALAAAALVGTRKPPLVWHLHDYLGPRRAMRPILRALTGRCAAILAVSADVAADAGRVLPVRNPVHAVHNAIDLKRFRPDGPALDLDGLAGLPFAPAGTRRVGLVATFAHWKGHETFLRAASALIHGGLPDTRFYVVGGPIYATAGSQRTTAELRAMAPAGVGFTGFVADAPGALRALDVVVHASTRPEPFGLVLVQAMACGRALVASAAGGARELVTPETDALVHAPGDTAGLARQIGRALADPALRARLGAAGRRTAVARFSRERLAAEVVRVYEGLWFPAR